MKKISIIILLILLILTTNPIKVSALASAPTVLYSNGINAQVGDVNPTNVATSTPRFSFINNHGNTVIIVQVEVTLSSDTNYDTPIWRSGDIRTEPIGNGSRSPDIAFGHPNATYAPVGLLSNNQNYIWRARTYYSGYSDWSTNATINMQTNGNLGANIYIKQILSIFGGYYGFDAELSLLNQPTWAGVRGASNAGSYNIECTETTVSSEKGENGYFGIRRPPFVFNTSLLPDDATINLSSIFFYSTGKHNDDNDGYNYINVYQSHLANPNTVTLSDYSTVDSTPGSLNLSINSVPTSGSISFPLNTIGLSWISKTADTAIQLREGHDVNNHPYAGGNNSWSLVYIATTEYNGLLATKAPYIQIYYTPVAGEEPPPPPPPPPPAGTSRQTILDNKIIFKNGVIIKD
jgi:hypothetical protein